MSLSVDKLEAWVVAQIADDPTSLPTVREAARRFRVPQQEILDLADCFVDGCVNVAIGCGNGYAVYERIGDYELEAWGGAGVLTPVAP